MSREKNMFKIFKSILNKDKIQDLSKYLIYPTQNGYMMYGQYLIKSIDNNTVCLTKYHTHTMKNFHSLRNAIIWAIFDKSEKITQAKGIEELDKISACVDNNINVYRNIIKKSKNLERKSTAYAKLSMETTKKTNIQNELEYYINFSRKLQESNFDKLTK